MSAMAPRVGNHIERRNGGWNPSTALTPRQIEFVRAWRAMPGATLQAVADQLGITRATAAQHRDAAIALGVLGTSGYGSTRRVWLTELGRAVVHGA